MSTTTNLGISLIDPSEYISPTKINDGFTAIDPLGIDYITEQSKSGEWWFRKWKSGRAQCIIYSKTFPNQAMSRWGSAGVFSATNQLSFGAYPFSFDSRPFASIVLINADISVESFIVQHRTNSTSVSPTFRLVDSNTSLTSIAHPSFGIYVNGHL